MNTENLPGAGQLKAMGIISIILGVIALASPAVAAGAVILIVGILLLVAGVSQIFHGLKGTGWRHKIMPLVLGGITLLGGLGVLAHPIIGLEVLSLLLAGYFMVEGIWKILAAFRFRPNPAWIWMFLGGLLSLVLAYLIWGQWPLSGIIAVGVLVGIDLLTTGFALLMLGSARKQ